MGVANIKLNGMKAEEFPSLKEVAAPGISVKGMVTALKRISFSAPTEDSRPVLYGVILTPIDGNTIELAATDGFRLAITQVKTEGGPLPVKAIIPFDAVKAIEKLFTGEVTLKINIERVSVEANGLAMIFYLCQGTYPNYKQFIPKEGTLASFHRIELLEALQTIKVMGITSPITRLVTKNDNIATVSAGDEAEGSISVDITAEGHVKTSFNYNHLIDILKSTGDEAVTLQQLNPQSPILFQLSEATHVVMPMFVKWENTKKEE